MIGGILVLFTLDTEYMESYGRVEQRRQHLARDASHDDGRAAA